jgi:hypothetical protein
LTTGLVVVTGFLKPRLRYLLLSLVLGTFASPDAPPAFDDDALSVLSSGVILILLFLKLIC